MTQGKIYQKIADVMRDIDAIGKQRKNQQQNYNFRGIDDVYNELHAHLGKHGVFTAPEVLEDRTEERTTKSGTALIYRVLKIKFTFYCEDGSSVSTVVIGEGMDSGDKASNKAMAVGHKYALMQVFCIPTEEPKDPENDSHTVVPKTYQGTPEQKQQLHTLLTARGISDQAVMVSVHKALLGKPLSEQEAIIAGAMGS